MKKILNVFVILFIVFVPKILFSAKPYSEITKEWLNVYYKESIQQYKYTYDNNEKLSLTAYIYNYFLESSLKLWIDTNKIKQQNFNLLEDYSIELKPATNIIFRAIIDPKNKSISEIMVTVNKSSPVENFTLFYNLSHIAINMINIDITKYDVDSVYDKLSVEQIVINRNYASGLVKDGVDYSIFYIDDSVFFILKKTQLEELSFFKETEKERKLYNSRDEFANSDEFFDSNNRDLSDREDVAKANNIIDNSQKKSIQTKEQTSASKKESINNKSKPAPIIKNESYKVNNNTYPPYILNKEGFTEKRTITEQPLEKKKETVYWK